MISYLIFFLCTLIFRLGYSAPATKLNEPSKPNTTCCYDYVGCFDNNYPFDNTGFFLPSPPDMINTEFMLFTRQNRQIEQLLSYKDLNTITNSNFNKNLAIKFIVHGFGNDRDKDWLHIMKDTFLDVENLNVIIVAWGDGAKFPFYNNAATNIRLVGKEISLIVNLIKKAFYRYDPYLLRIHCVGHSLGAHTCGHAGYYSNIQFDRITGLDPANQFFENNDKIARLDAEDAKFVDVIHTNNGILLSGSFGIYMPVGHIDFYVNGGGFQTGCPALTSILGSVVSGSFDPTSDIGCSHNRAQWLFIESIKSSCSFMAFKCDKYENYLDGKCMSCDNNSCSVLGYYADGFLATGKFYVATAGEKPYCGDQYLFQMKLNENSPKTTGEINLDFDKETENAYSVQITDIDTELKSSTSVNKFFVSKTDLFKSQDIQMSFKEKKLSWIESWFYDPNETKFIYDKINIFNMDSLEIRSECSKSSLIETGVPKKIFLKENDCDY